MADSRFFQAETKLGKRALAQMPEILATHGLLKDAIDNAAELDDRAASVGSLGFLKDCAYQELLRETRLSAVVVSEEMADRVPKGTFGLISRRPRISFAYILKALYPSVFNTVAENQGDENVHPDAILDKGVRLGRGVLVGAGARIGADSQIGDYSVIGRGVQIGRDCRIGRHNTIRYTLAGDGFWCDDHNTLGLAGFAFEYTRQGHVPIAQVGLLRIGQDVHISSGCSIDRGALGDTIIEEQVQIESLCKIGHNVRIGKGTAIVGLCAVAGSAIIGQDVQIAGKVGVKGFTHIGDRAKVMACSAVTKDVAEGAQVFGVPAMPYREFAARQYEVDQLVRRKRKKV